jgi:hypothetical protein
MYNINPIGPDLPSGRQVTAQDGAAEWREVPRRSPESVLGNLPSPRPRNASRASTTIVSPLTINSPNYFAPLMDVDDEDARDFQEFDLASANSLLFQSLNPSPAIAAAASAPVARPEPRHLAMPVPQAVKQLRNRALNEPNMPLLPDFDALARAKGPVSTAPLTQRPGPMTLEQVVKDPRMIPGLDDTF